jgi:PPK2 family polyphosphate:nucleotide phosphotransferase
MPRKQILKAIESFIAPYRVTNGKRFRLKDVDPGDTHHLASEQKPQAKELLGRGVEWLAELQDKLYAQDSWSLLLIFQAMDAAGKDGTIKHVMSGVNPQGCQVFSFKVPSAEDLDHDYMWRYARSLPERGRIGIFNRSYYEEVLVVRVHPEILERQQLPPDLKDKGIWKRRFQEINNFEDYLVDNGTIVLKFFLNVSKEAQKKRFLERIDRPEKNWKFSSADAKERQRWDDYQAAYEDVLNHTSTKHAPWYVVPADHKWFSRLAVGAVILQTMRDLKLAYPTIGEAQKQELLKAKEMLESET